MTSSRDDRDGLDDLLDLFDHAWRRHRDRMAGLTDEEWRWQPVPDDRRLTLRRRLAHIAGLLREERNGPWLGLAACPAQANAQAAAPAQGAAAAAGAAPGPARAPDAATALRHTAEAYETWRAHLAALSPADLGAPVGPVAGPFAAATRRSFALHVADELIHHTAEAALLRDLYAALG